MTLYDLPSQFPQNNHSLLHLSYFQSAGYLFVAIAKKEDTSVHSEDKTTVIMCDEQKV